METVNNLASAASRAIWGEGEGQNKENTNEAQKGSNESGGQEPMSGQTGNVESGEPYDKGNAGEPSNTKTDSTNEPSTTDTSNKDTSNTESTQPSGKNMGNPSADPPKETTSETGDPASAQQNTQKHQGADRPGEGPDSGESQKIKDTKKEAEEAAAVDVSGPGPKTLEEKSKEGGAAGAGKKDDDDDGPQKESHGEGTGEKYVKSSGMKVDGGDFDASAAGAGKEADRLLEEKGIHHEVGAGGSSKTDESESTDKKDDGKEGKPSLKEKIKAKLHKN